MTAQHFAPDNVDRMLLRVLDETFQAEPWRKSAPVLVVNDATGALSAWVQAQGLEARFMQDSASLAAQQTAVTGPVATAPSPELFSEVATVIYRLARPLEALEEFSWHVARWAAPEVMVLAGQLQRHLNFSLNRVLDTVFEQVSASRGYYKARALRAQVPRPLSGTTPPRMPRKNTVSVAGQRLELRAYGLTFGAAKLDPGTRLLLETVLAEPTNIFPPNATVVDLGCGNGTIVTALAKTLPTLRLTATDDSASAVKSTTATLAANGVAGVRVLHQSGLARLADASVDVVLLNPPFHDGTELTTDIAYFLFEEAARTLKTGGVLLTVFNASQGYRPQLQARVGPTHQLARDHRFIITQSQKAACHV